jgi:hypothetical protein
LVFIRLFFAVELILRKGGTKYEEKEWGNWRGDEKESQLTVLYFFSFKKWKDWQLDSVLKVVEGFGKCSRGVSECQKPQGKVKCRIVNTSHQCSVSLFVEMKMCCGQWTKFDTAFTVTPISANQEKPESNKKATILFLISRQKGKSRAEKAVNFATLAHERSCIKIRL